MKIIYSLLEYVLAFMFIRGGLRILFFGTEPIQLPGILTYLVGEFAIFAYGAIFLFVGILLIASKLLKHEGLHQFSLLLMYLICIYVLVLAIMINGLGWGLLITVAVGITAAALWVRCKLQSDYLTGKELAEIRHEQEEPPPLP